MFPRLSISISNFLKLLNKLYKVSPCFYILNISKILGIPIENRIYREEFTRKKCKTAILLYCFHTAGKFMPYNLLGPGTSFYRKSKISIKRKSNYKIGWFQNWLMIISHRLSLYKRWFSVITINQMMFIIHLIHFIKFI